MVASALLFLFLSVAPTSLSFSCLSCSFFSSFSFSFILRSWLILYCVFTSPPQLLNAPRMEKIFLQSLPVEIGPHPVLTSRGTKSRVQGIYKCYRPAKNTELGTTRDRRLKKFRRGIFCVAFDQPRQREACIHKSLQLIEPFL